MAPATATHTRGRDTDQTTTQLSSVDDILTVLADINSRGGSSFLKQLVHESDAQGKKHKDLATAYATNIQTLAEVQIALSTETKQHKQTAQEKAQVQNTLDEQKEANGELRREIAAKTEEIKRVVAIMKKHEIAASQLESLKSQLDNARKALVDKAKGLETKSKALMETEDTLRRIQAFGLPLKELADGRQEIRRALGSALKSAHNLFQTHLGRDLEDDKLRDSMRWSSIGDHPSIRRSIPLPSSNSPAAKSMRVIAGLAILAGELAKVVFRPVYLTQDDDLDRILEALAVHDQSQEIHVRSILLNILPDHQDERQDACSRLVVDEVSSALRLWGSPDAAPEFYKELQSITSAICGAWRTAQTVKQKIEPSFAFDIPSDWQLLPVSSGNADKAPAATPSPRKPSAQPTPRPLTRGEPIRVIWPAFFATVPQASPEDDSASVELVAHGLVVRVADMKDAEEEMSRRGARRITRRNEARGSGNGKRPDSGIFLDLGASGGARGSDAK